MPRASIELTKKRKDEILDACKSIYESEGFKGLNIKQISTQTSFTRPAIYNYFGTKEEILLSLLIREYKIWYEGLEILSNENIETYTREKLASSLAHTLDDKEILLRILNMNLFDIELNCRIEHLAEFKALYLKVITCLEKIAKKFKKDASSIECEIFTINFGTFLIGVYPYAFHTDKQKEAMKLAGMEVKEKSLYELIYNGLMSLLPRD